MRVLASCTPRPTIARCRSLNDALNAPRRAMCDAGDVGSPASPTERRVSRVSFQSFDCGAASSCARVASSSQAFVQLLCVPVAGAAKCFLFPLVFSVALDEV